MASPSTTTSPASAPPPSPPSPPPATPKHFVTVDITDLVKGWLNGTYVNNGLALLRRHRHQLHPAQQGNQRRPSRLDRGLPRQLRRRRPHRPHRRPGPRRPHRLAGSRRPHRRRGCRGRHRNRGAAGATASGAGVMTGPPAPLASPARRGSTGPSGAQGITGPRGSTGSTGAQGAAGPTGARVSPAPRAPRVPPGPLGPPAPGVTAQGLRRSHRRSPGPSATQGARVRRVLPPSPASPHRRRGCCRAHGYAGHGASPAPPAPRAVPASSSRAPGVAPPPTSPMTS